MLSYYALNLVHKSGCYNSDVAKRQKNMTNTTRRVDIIIFYNSMSICFM